MNPGDNETGNKGTVGPFSKKPLIRYPAGSPDFSPGPRAVPVTQPISSQVFSFPLSAASPMFSPLWTSSASSFGDLLSTWSPSPSSSLQPQSPSLSFFGGSSSVPVEENRGSMNVSGNTVPPKENDLELILNGDSSHELPMEELTDEIIKLNEEENRNESGVKRRAEDKINPVTKPQNRRALKNRPYTSEELQQISACERLQGLASDPRKIRKILANRETAKLSKQRKSQYIIALENKVATLSNENASLKTENASLKTKLFISEKLCQTLELSTRESNNKEMQMNNQFNKPNMCVQSNNIEQTSVHFENPEWTVPKK